jgi:UDP-N-acetylglucosamine 2-epimerase (non-hydrolysing)
VRPSGPSATFEELKEALSRLDHASQSASWTASLPARKRAEAEFHDWTHDAEQDPSRFTPDQLREWEQTHPNMKYYATDRASAEHRDRWVREHAPGHIFLDYCCGRSTLGLMAARAGSKLTIGIDISPESIRACRRRAHEQGLTANTHYVVGDSENTGLPDASVDRVVAAGCLHHLDLSYALPELRRILKPGGRVYASEALSYNPAIQLYRRMTPHLRTEFEKHHILSLADLTFAQRFFDVTNVRYFHLFSIAMTPLRRTRYFSTALRIADAIDRVVLAVPPLSYLACSNSSSVKRPSTAVSRLRRLRVLCVVGARPNFMKIAPLMRALRARPGLTASLVNTGQHYDRNMASGFLAELGIGSPDYELSVGSGSHAVQTARILVKFEKLCLDARPDCVVVVGDVNSTIACALVAAKLEVPVAHVEAGLRSFDRSMPEEVNRVATDALSTWFFTTEASANRNLRKEGIPLERIHFVGNTMIDNLLHQWPRILKSTVASARRANRARPYAVVTLHRPSNVDSRKRLLEILDRLEVIQHSCDVVFPVHPRTRAQLERLGILHKLGRLRGMSLVEPMGYVDFLALCRTAQFVLTDSGGIQEETTRMRVPCLTLRENTERPVTVTIGTNRLISLDTMLAAAQRAIAGRWPRGRVPPKWDGQAGVRIAKILEHELRRRTT